MRKLIVTFSVVSDLILPFSSNIQLFPMVLTNNLQNHHHHNQ